MASINSIIKHDITFLGGKRAGFNTILAEIEFSASYSTGGEAISVANLNTALAAMTPAPQATVASIVECAPVPAIGGLTAVPYWDQANLKMQAMQDIAAGAALAEVAAAVNMSGAANRFMASFKVILT